MAELQRSKQAGVPKRRYTEEDIERGLQALIAAGCSYRRAAEMVGIPAETLLGWRKHRFKDRYEQMREELAPKIRQRIAQQAEDLALVLAEKELEGIASIDFSALAHRDRAGALRNITTSKGINLDKVAVLRQLPTAVIEHRQAGDILKKWAELGVIEGSARERDA